MKFLIFAPYYIPHIGGVENYIEEFSREITLSENDSVIIFAPHIPKVPPLLETNASIVVIHYPAIEIVLSFPFPCLWSAAYWRSYSLIRKERIDFVISHTRFFFSSFIALIFAKLHKKPLIHIEHGSSFVVVSSSLISAFSKFYDLTIGKLILRKSTINISISSAVQEFVKYFDNRHSPIIHRGINFDTIDVLLRSMSKEVSTTKVRFISVGRLTKWKGIQNTIQAIHNLPPATQEKLIFTIIGDGEEKLALMKMAKHTPCIEFSGSIPREQVFKKLMESDVFIHSSLPGGGLATTLLEAMACGLAIIATPNEGALDVIIDKENGLLLKSEAPETLGDAIEYYLNQPTEIKRLSAEASQSVRRNFSWESSIKEFKQVIYS